MSLNDFIVRKNLFLFDIVFELFVCLYVLFGEEWVLRVVFVVFLDGVVG